MSLGKVTRTSRGFEVIEFEDCYANLCSLQQSSAIIGEDDEAWERPGSSAVWLGRDTARMHLDREMVKDLIMVLERWLETGSFEEGKA